MTGPDEAKLMATLHDVMTRVLVPDGQPAPVDGDGASTRMDALLVAMGRVILPRCLTLADAAGRRIDLHVAHRALHGWSDTGDSPAWPVATAIVRAHLLRWLAGPCTLTVTLWEGPAQSGTDGLPVTTLSRASPPRPAIAPMDHLDRFVATLDTAEAALIRIDADAVTATDGAEPGLSRLIAFAEATWDDLLADPGPADMAQLIVLTTADGHDPGQAILLAKAGTTRLLLRFGAHLAMPVVTLWLDCGVHGGQDAL